MQAAESAVLAENVDIQCGRCTNCGHVNAPRVIFRPPHFIFVRVMTTEAQQNEESHIVRVPMDYMTDGKLYSLRVIILRNTQNRYSSVILDENRWYSLHGVVEGLERWEDADRMCQLGPVPAGDAFWDGVTG